MIGFKRVFLVLGLGYNSTLPCHTTVTLVHSHFTAVSLLLSHFLSHTIILRVVRFWSPSQTVS